VAAKRVVVGRHALFGKTYRNVKVCEMLCDQDSKLVLSLLSFCNKNFLVLRKRMGFRAARANLFDESHYMKLKQKWRH